MAQALPNRRFLVGSQPNSEYTCIAPNRVKQHTNHKADRISPEES